MAIGNDEKILELKKQIEIKKSKLEKSNKFSPVTNCSLDLDGIRFNLNVLNKEQLILIAVKLNMYNMSYKNLEFEDEFIITGYSIKDWLTDIKSKIDILSKKEEESKLKVMESKLNQLLSEDKKVELELSEIEKLLK